MHSPIVYSMYYVAIVCPRQVNDEVLQYKNWMKEQFGCIAALKSPGHITLIPPFWMNEQRENEFKLSLSSFSPDVNGLEIRMDGFFHFNNRVLFVNVNDHPMLQELKDQVEKHFIPSFGDIIKIDKRAFHPHITIANRDMKPGDFENAWQYFANKEIKKSFLVQDISILKLKKSDTHWQVIYNREL